MKPRQLFTDGWNSFWHVVFGILAIRYIIIMPIFVIYQFIDIYEKNLLVDLTEFFIGFFGTMIALTLLEYDIKYTTFPF